MQQSTGRRGQNLFACYSHGKALSLILEIAQEFWPRYLQFLDLRLMRGW